MTGTILAVGAAGKFAGLVVPELVKRGAKVRGLVRNAGQVSTVRQHGAADIAVGDLRDQASLEAALKGVEAVFYIAPAFLPDEAAVGVGMVDAAKRAGVRRFVFSSVIHPALTALSNHRDKAPVEEAMLVSGMEYTILQPAMFYQNLAAAWPKVAGTGVFAEPWSTRTRFTRVDYRDVAEAAAIALTEDRLLHGTFELSAEGELDRYDVAALMGAVAGRTVEAAQADPPAGTIETPIGTMFAWYDTHGLLGNPLVLRAILGREPRTLRAYFEELAARPQAPR